MAGVSDPSKKNASDGKSTDDDPALDKYKNAKPVPFLSLFRHGTPKDKSIMVIGIVTQCFVGVSFAAMNLVFGEVIDDLSSPTGSVLDATSNAIKIMLVLAACFGLAAFIGMSFIPYGAARITNRVRNEYVKAVLGQDMAFFDESRPGEVVAALSEYTLDFEEGLSTKLGEGLQATCGALGGLIVALYFSWQITVACLVAVPLMCASFYMMLQSGAGNDGLLGKEAYESAANIADETLSSMSTIASFVGETKAASRYEAHLGEAEEAAIRQGKKLGLGTGLLWGSFYAMMGIGFWWGGRLVIGSTQQAMIDNPIPSDFYTNPIYAVNLAVATEACQYRPLGTFGKGDFIPYEGEGFEACVCGMPWAAVADTIDTSDVDWAITVRARDSPAMTWWTCSADPPRGRGGSTSRPTASAREGPLPCFSAS